MLAERGDGRELRDEVEIGGDKGVDGALVSYRESRRDGHRLYGERQTELIHEDICAACTELDAQ